MMDSLVLWIFAFFFCLCLTSSALAQNTANPSQGSPIYVPIKYKQKTADLHCPMKESNPLLIQWLRHGTLIDPDNEETSHVDVTRGADGSSKMSIANPTEADLGNYTCELYNPNTQKVEERISANFVVHSELTLKLADAYTVIEGAELRMHCHVSSKTPPYTIKWRFENRTYEESEGRIFLLPDENKVPNAIFKIEAAVMEDRGSYTCMGYATPVANATEMSTYVRVKDKYAALWPFLGICAEVVVLVAIIMIYERKRNQAELEESDTDQSPDQQKKSPPKK